MKGDDRDRLPADNGRRISGFWREDSPYSPTDPLWPYVLASLTALTAAMLAGIRPEGRIVALVFALLALVWSVALIGSRVGATAGVRLQLPGASRLPALRQTLTVERRLLGLLLPYKGIVGLGLGITVAIAATGVAKPWPTKILIDDVLGDGDLWGVETGAALAIVVILTVVLFLAGGALALLQTRLLYGLTQRLIRELRARLFARLTRLSLRFHDERGVGDSAYRISADTYSLHTILLSGLVPFTGAVFTLGGTAVVMFGLDPLLAVLALSTVPAAAAITQRFGRRIRRSSLEVRERESDVYTHAEQTLTGIRVVQAFAREPYELERFSERADRSRNSMVKLVTQQTVFGLAVDAVLGIGLALVTLVAALRAIDGHITTGEVIVFLAYVGALYLPISELAGVFGELQTAAAGAQRVFDVLDEPEPADSRSATAPTHEARGTITFEGVTFSYLEGHPILHDVHLRIEAGETVALVGPTGAGKSTLAALLLRLYDPDQGRVLLDDHDLRQLPLAWVREQIAFVPQDPILFPGTVRDNIRYGRLSATEEEIEEAVRRANIFDELLEQPQGLDTPVGDRGVTLSGGQRQRVAIARAFLKDAPIILLDEPTSALDASTEALIMEALWRLIAGRTCLVIAHRLATVHRAHQVVVLHEGRIIQQGTHPSLVRRQGLYKDLHAARFGAVKPVVKPSDARGRH